MPSTSASDEATRATLGGHLGVTELSPIAPGFTSTAHCPSCSTSDLERPATTPVAMRGDGRATLDLAVRGTLTRPLPIGTLTVSSPSIAYGALRARDRAWRWTPQLIRRS